MKVNVFVLQQSLNLKSMSFKITQATKYRGANITPSSNYRKEMLAFIGRSSIVKLLVSSSNSFQRASQQGRTGVQQHVALGLIHSGICLRYRLPEENQRAQKQIVSYTVRENLEVVVLVHFVVCIKEGGYFICKYILNLSVNIF